MVASNMQKSNFASIPRFTVELQKHARLVKDAFLDFSVEELILLVFSVFVPALQPGAEHTSVW